MKPSLYGNLEYVIRIIEVTGLSITSLCFEKLRYSDISSKLCEKTSITSEAFGKGIDMRKLAGLSTSNAAM